MPINPDLLIAAPMLQDFLIDKDGTPMSGGTITLYHDNSRTTLKNWYYQSGTPGNYTYIPLPNPMTLSAAGTIEDANGVDTIPFYYPFSENNETVADPYYITIVNFAQTNQITRANFPFVSGQTAPAVITNQFNNLVINNGFWRNIQPNTLNEPLESYTLNSVTQIIVAPSQHDTFRYPDIQFLKNNTSANDAVTFIPFPIATSQPINNTVVPEYYLNHVCSSSGTGETQKVYQFPIALHVNSLANVPFTVYIQAQNGAVSEGNTITLKLFQDTGTGTTPPAPVVIGSVISLTSAWTAYQFTSVFPNPIGLSLSVAADDAFYLQVELPHNATCNINFTKPSIYLTQNVVPNYDFVTYDQVDAVINSPRTGDIRTSLNAFYFYGWLPLNGGTIGFNSAMGATYYPSLRNNQDTFPLYSLIWNLFKNFNNGTANPLSQMIAPTSSNVAYGANAYADFIAGNSLTLTSSMGNVILGTVPVNALTTLYQSTFTGAVTTITPTNTMAVFNGMPVYFVGTTTLATNKIYYVGFFSGTTFEVFNTFADAMSLTSPQSVDATGTVVSAFTGTFEGEYRHLQLETELAQHTHAIGVYDVGGAGANVPMSTNDTTLLGTPLTSVTPITPTNAFNVTQPGTFYNMFIKL